MKFQTKAILGSLLASGALVVAAAPAQAFNFNTDEALGECDPSLGAMGQSCATADGFTLEVTKAGEDGSLGGTLVTKTVDGTTGVGVYGDPSKEHGSSEELDYGEEITASLATAEVIKSIELAFMYQPGEWDDGVFEVAEVTAGGKTGTLAVTGDETATWTYDGKETLLSALSPSVEGGGGLYSILNPFGNIAVDTIVFNSFFHGDEGQKKNEDKCGSTLTSECGAFSDYSIAGISTASVPEPGLMLGLGVVGGAMYASRRRRA